MTKKLVHCWFYVQKKIKSAHNIRCFIWTCRYYVHGDIRCFRSFTVRLMRYHILLLSSRLIVCLMTLTWPCCFFVCASIRQSRRCTFLSPLACCRSSAFRVWQYLRPSFSSSMVNLSGVCMLVHTAKRITLLTFLAFPSFNRISWRKACILSYHIWIAGL